MLAVLALVATACQPLPQPFQPDASNKTANPLLKLADRSGVVVRPVQGMPEDTGAVLARAMATALVDRNLPAFTEDGNSSSLVLTGQAIATPRGSARSEIRVIWRVSDRNGIQQGEHVLDIAARKTAWANGSPTLLREIAQKSAGKIAEIVQGPAERDRTADRVQRTLHVWKIDGAPETAGALLRSELETALRRQALRVTSKMRDNSVIVVGTVQLTPTPAGTSGPKGRRELHLDWVVMSADGRELGKLRQKNSVAPEVLENDWPKIARGIALGAAQGIRDVLEKVPESALSGAPSDAPAKPMQ
ncbi:MAG: hypothetical protein ACI9JL_002439 [Paracoccaceae bacterium]|jgi:hypothetical protein